MNLKLILKAIRAFRAGRVGDAAVYKAAAISAPAYPDVDRRVRQLANPFPTIDLHTLRKLKSDTFGHAYALFMQENFLTPLVISPETADELASTNVLAVRYPILHDAFHVLLGFDASLPGELGVWTFVAGQHYSPSFDRAAMFTRLLYPMVAPLKFGELRQQGQRGRTLARQVPCLIAQPIDKFWHESLAEVREKLRITAPGGR
ncbi:MAG: Coq4 family protein [Betaproteobacteria bacterium]